MHYDYDDDGGGGDGDDGGDGGDDGDDAVAAAVAVVLAWSCKLCWDSLCKGRSCIVRKGDHSGCE